MVEAAAGQSDFGTARAALLVLDFQNDLVHPDGAFRHWGIPYRVAENGVLARCVQLIAAARQGRVPVIFMRYIVRPWAEAPAVENRFYRMIRGSGGFRWGTWGVEIHADLASAATDIIVDKWRPNPFQGTDLEIVLHALGARTLVLAGIVTEWVVEEAARQATALGYHVIVAADCCESARDDLRDHSLRRILPQIAEVRDARVIGARWNADRMGA